VLSELSNSLMMLNARGAYQRYRYEKEITTQRALMDNKNKIN